MNGAPETFHFGKTGLRMPRLAFGTAPLAVGPAWSAKPIPAKQAADTLIYAFEHGVTWFDSAPNYVHGLAETRTGWVIGGLPRQDIIVDTKVGFDISGPESRRDYSRDGVLRSLEGSLKRLQVDHVELVYVHDPDDYADVVLRETFPALAELRAQGVIKAIGAGMNQWQVPLRFAREADFDCFMIAGRWTLLEQGALPLLDYCHAHDIAIFAASIYNSGILATGAASPQARYNHAPASDAVRARVGALEALCRAHDVPLHTAATQFPLLHPAVRALVVGFQTPGEVQACLDALDYTVPDALWAALQDSNLVSMTVPQK
jgi:D-threo-aldose 1-dehydrogenase